MNIEKITKTLYVGAHGEHFETAERASMSIVVHELSRLLDEASYSRDYDTLEAAEYLVSRKEDIINLLGCI